MNLQALVRNNIWNLVPYSCARNEFKGEASVFLDANENPLNDPYNRYPDPFQDALKQKVSKVKSVDARNIFFGNGSDEPIDLVVRIFCEPRVDNIVAMDPTYGMYQVCADINDVEYRKVLLNDDFSLDAGRLLAATDAHTKLIFLCSPNNPTANVMNQEQVLKVVRNFPGIVILDEAYIDFAEAPGLLSRLTEFPNLIILQTFSKAWGMAAIRLGMAFATEEIIGLFNKVKYPYNINLLTQTFVGESVLKEKAKQETVQMLVGQRAFLKDALLVFPFIQQVYPSDANFLLVKVDDANGLYDYLINRGIVIRNRTKLSLCKNTVRITVGTPDENKALLEALKTYPN
ncbi:MAG TPA: histidinol-phosphate transaminase [Bacteroidales bacterium]